MEKCICDTCGSELTLEQQVTMLQNKVKELEKELENRWVLQKYYPSVEKPDPYPGKPLFEYPFIIWG